MIKIQKFNHFIDLGTQQFIIGQNDHFALRLSQNDHFTPMLENQFLSGFFNNKPSRTLFTLIEIQNFYYFTHLSSVLELIQNSP